MNLTSLILENYGKFKNFQCDFKPGLNVIKGGNETGKSTLVEAITSLLYGDPESPDKENIGRLKTWGADGSLILRANISSTEFNGVLEKNFDSGKISLANQDLNIKVEDKARIDDIVANAVGFPSAELFEATSCVKQGEISQIERSVKAIKDKLESLVTGGKEDLAASQIVAKIDKRIEDISRKDDVHPGLIQRIELAQKDLDYNIDKIMRDINNLKTWRTSIAQVEVAYANGLEDYEEKKQKLEELSKAAKAQNEFNRLKKEKEQLDSQLEKVKSSSLKANELVNQLKTAKEVSTADARQIDELESNLKYLRPKKRELETDVETDQETYDQQKTSGVAIALPFVALGAIGFAAADFLYLHLTQYIYEIGGAGLALLLFSLLILSKSIAKKSFLKEQVKSKTAKLEKVQEEIEELTEQLDDLLKKYSIRSAEEAMQASWKADELKKQLKQVNQDHNQYLGGLSEEEIEIKTQNIEKDLLDTRVLLENIDTKDISDIERLKLIVSQLEEQKVNLEKELHTLNRQIETAEGGAELLASYNERKEQTSAEKIKLVEEVALLNLTKDCIEKARQNVMISTLELLEKRTSEILEIITAGKYEKVKFDKTSLKFKVFSKEKNDWVEPHQELSKATVEQIYLTARLALTEILSDKAKPPIILDDAFDNFDPDRHEGTMVLLKQMARDRQILLLTSDDHYDSWADNTIQL